MIWHAFNVKRGLSIEYRRVPKPVRADHFTLLLRCAELENGGVIRNAGAFTDDDWLCLGIRTREVDALVAYGLARWVPSAQLPLVVPRPDREVDPDRIATGSRDPLAIHDEIRQKTLQEGSVTDRDMDRAIHDEIRHFEGCDLVVVDYDVGGEERNRELSEAGQKGAISRWNQPEQRSLPFPPAKPPPPPPESCRDPSRSGLETGSRDPAIGQANGQANARHDTERHETLPPTPSLAGGGVSRSFVRHPSKSAWLRFQSFWTWLQQARPQGLDRHKWGGGAKKRARYVVWRQAEMEARLRRDKEPDDEDVLALLDKAREDLGKKFRNGRWLRDASFQKWSVVTYFADEHYHIPLHPEAPTLTLVEDPAEVQRRADAAAAEEAEVRATWTEEMPGEEWPGDVEEAKRRLTEKHGWKK